LSKGVTVFSVGVCLSCLHQLCCIKFDVWLAVYLKAFEQVMQYTRPANILMSGFTISLKMFHTKLRPVRWPAKV